MTTECKANVLCDRAIDWMREAYPGAIIVTELSVADWGGAMIDVAAINEDRIVGVEIKGAGDSPSRLELQGVIYPRVAKEMWLLCCPSVQVKCFSKRPHGWGRLEVWEGRVRPYNSATKAGAPIRDGNCTRYPSVRDDSRYRPDKPWPQTKSLTPSIMCEALWRDELYEIANSYGLVRTRRPVVQELTDAICSSLPVTLIHDEMISALRKRDWKKPVLDLRSTARLEVA